MPAADPVEDTDLLRRLLDHARIVETLDGEIRAASVELREMRKRRKDAVAARPMPILGEKPAGLPQERTGTDS